MGALVNLDRRVEIVEGPSDVKGKSAPISELRSRPYVVLLGEPGSGKSSVLAIEAAAAGQKAKRPFELETLLPGSTHAPLFIDALDEYRVDGRGVEKAFWIGKTLQIVGATQWRITCRSEDWRKEADLEALGRDIVVAKLLPLEPNEAAVILEQSLGEKDPNGFVRRAYELGADGFLRSPLSLKLLHKAVEEGGQWPRTRHELFEIALQRLAAEHNPIHKAASRHTRPEIIAAAETTCTALLLSGAHGIWRSHGEPPSSPERPILVHAYEIGVDGSVIDDMLDSSLFVGEGELFEPMHRTVAEFLAGHRLARAVVPGGEQVAIPLPRALALVTGSDGQPPTPLRGIYAWLTIHLWKLGEHSHAEQLIEKDAPTILFYGDASAFDTSRRRLILQYLTRSDPYFRATHKHDTVVASLGGPDLTTEFLAVLNDQDDHSHRMLTVFDILEQTFPEELIRSHLYDLVLDTTRPSWQRLRAADAWLRGAGEKARLLWSAMDQLPPSLQREELRLHLAGRLPTGTLTLAEIKQLIADFAATPEDDTVGRLIGLWDVLGASLFRELLDEPRAHWLPATADHDRSHRVELDGFFDHALAEAIDSDPRIPPARIWRWICNFREYEFQELPERSAQALRRWLALAPDHPVGILECILDSEEHNDAPWLPMNHFVILCGWAYDTVVIPYLLNRADREPANKKWFVAAAVHQAKHHPGEPVHAKTVRYLSTHPEHEGLDHLLAPRAIEVATPQERRETDGKEKRIAQWTPLIERIRACELPGVLAWGAEHYFDVHSRSGVDGIRIAVNDEITAAILEGWRHVVTHGLGGITIQLIAKLRGGGLRYYPIETAALAGIDYQLNESELPSKSVALPVVIAALETSWKIKDKLRRDRLVTFAIRQLERDPIGGSTLCEFWRDAFEAGANHLESFDQLADLEGNGSTVQAAVTRLITARRNLPPSVLRRGLRGIAKSIAPHKILGFAMDALDDEMVRGRERVLWTIVAFAVAPKEYSTRLGMIFGETPSDLLEELRSLDLEVFSPLEPSFRVVRMKHLFTTIGPKIPPNEELWVDRDDSLLARYAMRNLQSSHDVEAGDTLQLLAKDPHLVAWRPQLLHAHAEWAKEQRDRTHRYPTTKAVLAVLRSGPPANHPDLMAIVESELRLHAHEVRCSDLDSWKIYWNSDPHKPLVENECRNRLLGHLRPRLSRYGIFVALPEVQCQGATRTDISVFSKTGQSLPVEMKRHMNPELWSAPSKQLVPYTLSQGDQRFGIYLVLWFGLNVQGLPTRDDGHPVPSSASSLEELLQKDVSDLSATIKVIVLDVSDPRNPSRPKRKVALRTGRRRR